MAAQVEDFTVQIADRISGIDPVEWDACARDDPFTCHAHLLALEESRSVSPATGFQPSHLILRDLSGQIAAVAPTYIKSHSEGEIGADMGWNLAHERFCGPYYPKIQVEVPFCPFPGSRLLVRQGLHESELRGRLVQELKDLTNTLGLSSFHVTYMTAEEWRLSQNQGLLTDFGIHFVWKNRNYADFDEFLQDLKKKKRQMIRSERFSIQSGGLEWSWLSSDELNSSHASMFYNFYRSTYQKYQNKISLNEEYFNIVFDTMKNNIFLIFSTKNGINNSALFSFMKQDRLYLQHWGTTQGIRFLHFETAIYQAMDYALANGVSYIDASVNGQHKVSRGFLPARAYHAHWFHNLEFSNLIAGGVKKRTQVIADQLASLSHGQPFRQTSG